VALRVSPGKPVTAVAQPTNRKEGGLTLFMEWFARKVQEKNL